MGASVAYIVVGPVLNCDVYRFERSEAEEYVKQTREMVEKHAQEVHAQVKEA